MPSFLFGIYLFLVPQSELVSRHPRLLLAVASCTLCLVLPYDLLSLCLLPIGLGIAALVRLEKEIRPRLVCFSLNGISRTYFLLNLYGPLLRVVPRRAVGQAIWCTWMVGTARGGILRLRGSYILNDIVSSDRSTREKEVGIGAEGLENSTIRQRLTYSVIGVLQPRNTAQSSAT